MSLFDFIIVYLACGASVGANYYFQNHTRHNFGIVARRTVFVVLGWLPFVVKSMIPSKKLRLKTFFKINFKINKDSDPTLNLQENISSLKKQLENFVFQSSFNTPIFEFREIVERYSGLMLAVGDETEPTFAEKNLFQIDDSNNSEISARCLHRRNRKRLIRHQSEARRDFLQLLEESFVFESDKKKLGILAIEFVKLLNDSESETAVRHLMLKSAPPKKRIALERSEKDLWNKETPRTPPAEKISYPLKNLTATAALSNKE